MPRLDSGVIGTAIPAHTVAAERGRLRFFADATGQHDPVYRDLDAARAAGHPDLPIPPTFLFCMEMDRPDPDQNVVRVLGIDPLTILHGEQQFFFHRLAYAGEPLTFSSSVSDYYEKKGGALKFVVRTTAVTRDGAPIACLRATTIVRDPRASR
ncbi:MaoC family dehydratase N-terminal domain-containing protein [Nocardia pseudobrasiliensis]|uniref:Acyl dehydratase n=1 Tax=Nocardia pseudobrasiliensis TaxID=45979 RepID=A0A370HPL6_9NOCA|nr:MaoC family dehydratase N-terminal domain-containing protein [Nocardia pseudobrasiliensis]RDI60523.1 acyl dehydratase [Nocardia pseudobrasiliensis]